MKIITNLYKIYNKNYVYNYIIIVNVLISQSYTSNNKMKSIMMIWMIWSQLPKSEFTPKLVSRIMFVMKKSAWNLGFKKSK